MGNLLVETFVRECARWVGLAILEVGVRSELVETTPEIPET